VYLPREGRSYRGCHCEVLLFRLEVRQSSEKRPWMDIVIEDTTSTVTCCNSTHQHQNNNNIHLTCGDTWVHSKALKTDNLANLEKGRERAGDWTMPFIPFVTAALVKASLQLCDSIQVEGLEHLFNAFAQGKPILTSGFDSILNYFTVIIATDYWLFYSC